MRRGFTLIEIAAVVVIVGLLASSATLAVVRLTRTISIEDAASAVEDFDAMARLLSDRDDTVVTLEIDHRKGEIVRRSRSDVRRLSLPRGTRLRNVGGSPDTITLRGSIGPTYAVRLESDERSMTLLFAGIGGQATRYEKEADVEAIFERLSQ